MAKTFICDRLPVPLTLKEEQQSAALNPDARIMSYTKLRMIRPGIARAIVEDGMVVVYHCMDNSRVLNGNAVKPLEFDLDDGPAIEALLDSYPHGVIVSEIPHPSEEEDDKVSVATALFKEGFLLVLDEATLPLAGDGNDSDDNDPF
jgi:lysine-specific demethylase/histidyl-hydroxylase NO66